MLNRLIQWSLDNRAVVVGASLLVLGLGLFSGLRLPVEVLPDLTKPTVVILTEASGLAPEEVETRVTQPLESALMGVAGLTRLRSNSDVALSLVYAEFEWGTDIYHARVLVQERLQAAREQLPENVQPFMTPVASLMGEILLVGVRSKVGKEDPAYLAPAEVRTIADWTIRRRLLTIPGIAEILNMGGGIRRIEVQPDPYRSQAYDVSLADLKEAAHSAASTTTGGFISSGSREIMVRNLSMTTELADIAGTAIKQVGDRTITIGDVAAVKWGIEPMRGDAAISRAPEKAPTYGVIMSVTKSPGADTRALTARIEEALRQLQPALPAEVETTLLFQQKDFIDHAIGNLEEAIRDGAIMVTLVLFLFLLNVRTTFITLMAMPMSFAMTLLTFDAFGISVNSMTLGGLAVAIGMVVDDAIVDVENVFRRLRENAALEHPQPRLMVIARASSEVRSSIWYATVLIILVFLPLLGLAGLEGKLFAPIAIATIVSMLASFAVSLTLIPVLCSFLLRPPEGQKHREAGIVRLIKRALRATALRVAFGYPMTVLLVVTLALAGGLVLYQSMGKDFLPSFREETALIATTAAPGTSLEQMNEIAEAIERQILQVPEVHQVGRRLGRAERGDHVVPVSTAEFDVDFQPGEGGRSRSEILAEINQRIRTVPGTFSVVSGPLADRIGHLMSGVSAPVAIKVFGPDLDVLRRLGTQVQEVAKTIPGFEDAKLDQQAMIPQLRIEPDRARAATYGITPGAINEQISTLVGGESVAELWAGQQTMDLVIRLPAEWREDPERIAQILVETASRGRIPLSELADVREATGPNVIFRENGQRRFTIAVKPSARDVGAKVNELRRRVEQQVQLPDGYFIAYEGEFEAQREASRRILILSTAVIAIIALLLYGYFKSWILALQVLLSIPLALLGGIVFTWLKLDNISIATLVGFIAVAGVAARNGIMMLSHYLHLMQHEGEEFTREMVERGTLERMVPVLMTACAAGIALIPLVLAGDQPGKEILHPVAVVIVGGLVSSTLLEFFVRPLLFFRFGRAAALQALKRKAAAAH